MSNPDKPSLAQQVTVIRPRRQATCPKYTTARNALETYLRFWELAEIDRALTPHTCGPPTTATRFLDRAPAALLQMDFEALAEAIEARLVRPLSYLPLYYEEWAFRFLEGNPPLLEPYPMGPCFSWEDLDLSYHEPKDLEPSFAFFWLMHARWAVEAEEIPALWTRITAGCGFPETPLPARTLGLAAGSNATYLNADIFKKALEARGLAVFYPFLLVTLGETGCPYLDYNPYQDGALPWEMDFTPESLHLLQTLFEEAESLLETYRYVLTKLQKEPQLFPQLVEMIEHAHLERSAS